MVTKTWICDSCGKEISRVKNGWVEWLASEQKGGGARGIRLVHNAQAATGKLGKGCHYGNKKGMRVLGSSMDYFLGANGLMKLLSLVAEGEIEKADVLEMIKRLHIPGYEYSRKHFAKAIKNGVFEPTTRESYYHLSDIKATLDYMKIGRTF